MNINKAKEIAVIAKRIEIIIPNIKKKYIMQEKVKS